MTAAAAGKRASGRKLRRKALLTVLAYVVALIMFFPILWMLLTAFKTEAAAFTVPPHLFFRPTLASFGEALARGDYLHYALNSLVSSLSSSLNTQLPVRSTPSGTTALPKLWEEDAQPMPKTSAMVTA